MTEKDLRNKRVLDLHNEGKTMGEISKVIGVGKTTVHSILNKMLLNGEAPNKEVLKEVKLTGTEERFTSFVGWDRINVNEYSNRSTGEVVRVAYVKASKDGEFGYFVRLNDNLGEK